MSEQISENILFLDHRHHRMRRLEIHSNYLILVEEGATGAPKLLPLGSEQLEDHLSTILQ